MKESCETPEHLSQFFWQLHTFFSFILKQIIEHIYFHIHPTLKYTLQTFTYFGSKKNLVTYNKTDP